MSHGRERTEKDCLNCGATVQGRYCQACGQENIEPKETFWTMFTHFFNDVTHFDGKFFETLKDLLFKPGFLSTEYMKGRRMSYLNPVRMYVFTSALFFLTFFGLKTSESVSGSSRDVPLTANQRAKKLEQVRQAVLADSADKKSRLKYATLIDTNIIVTQRMLDDIDQPQNTDITFGSKLKEKTLREYDSTQKALEPRFRDGLIERTWNRKVLSMRERYGNGEASRKLVNIFLHNMPYMLFVSLPLFALILKLLYVRQRKEFYYADHGIFSIHHYVFSFILLLTGMIFDKLGDITDWWIWDILISVMIFVWPFHMYKAMRRFYKQRRLKTFTKFCILNFLGFIMILVLFVLFGIISIFQL